MCRASPFPLWIDTCCVRFSDIYVFFIFTMCTHQQTPSPCCTQKQKQIKISSKLFFPPDNYSSNYSRSAVFQQSIQTTQTVLIYCSCHTCLSKAPWLVHPRATDTDGGRLKAQKQSRCPSKFPWRSPCTCSRYRTKRQWGPFMNASSVWQELRQAQNKRV